MKDAPAKRRTSEMRAEYDFSAGVRGKYTGRMQEMAAFGSRWLDQRIEAINICMGAGFAEAALTLLYSGIDTLAFLGAPAGAKDVKQDDFVKWCDRYIVPLLSSTAAGADLYGARCGVLHTSSAASRMGRQGDAREVWYHFKDRAGVNLMANTPRPALMLEIEALVDAFGKGSRQFVADLEGDPVRRANAQERAGQFFSWGILASGRGSMMTR